MRLPLEDLRVVAVEQYGAAPFATMQLADLGAEVIKVEDPGARGDVSRYIPPYARADSSLFFESFNRGKRSVVLDIKNPAGRRAFESLVSEADAVVSNLRGDQAERLRLRYDDLRGVNELIVCIALSGFGNTGPRRDHGGYDYTIQGYAGWMSLTGGPEESPTKAGLSLVDYCGGYVVALALLAGVWQARRDGCGLDGDISLFETALAQLTYIGTWVATEGFEPRRLARSAHQTVVPFQTFPTRDGWIVIACPKQTLFEALCGVIGLPELPKDPRFGDFEARLAHQEELIAILDQVLAKRPTASWLKELAEGGIPCGPVNAVTDALTDEQATQRGVMVDYEHPVLGSVRGVGSPLRVGAAPAPAKPGPLLGADTADVLTHVCGFQPDELVQLRDAGAFGDVSVSLVNS